MTTKVVKISSPAVEVDKLLEAADIIKAGGLVVFPTETVYGLGADATNADAVCEIFKAKGRPQDNPLIIHISTPSEAEKYTYTTELYYRLAKSFMPGPLTVILPSRDVIPSVTRGGLSTVAVRCPENAVARELIRLSGVPIAAPSANLSGSPSPTEANHVKKDMLGRCDMIIDGGDCDFGLESTIVKIEDNDTVTLLRPGKITREDISALGIRVNIADAVLEKLADGQVALSPGMKYRHYAPRADVLLLDGAFCERARYIGEYQADKIAIIAYSEELPAYREAFPNAVLYDFGLKDDKLAQAHSLFGILREADEAEFDVIFAPLPHAEGIGLALYNRMIRAAAYKIIKL